jgi:hypothetical protein
MDKLLKAIGWFFLVWIGIAIIARFFAAIAAIIGFLLDFGMHTRNIKGMKRKNKRNNHLQKEKFNSIPEKYCAKNR